MNAAIRERLQATKKPYCVIRADEATDTDLSLALANATGICEADFEFREISADALDDVIRFCLSRIREADRNIATAAKDLCDPDSRDYRRFESFVRGLDRCTASLEMAIAFLMPARLKRQILIIDENYGGYPGPAESVLNMVKKAEKIIGLIVTYAQLRGVPVEETANLVSHTIGA